MPTKIMIPRLFGGTIILTIPDPPVIVPTITFKAATGKVTLTGATGSVTFKAATGKITFTGDV